MRIQVAFEKVAGDDAIAEVARLAHLIWNKHYEPIIGRCAVAYMLRRFQSPESIRAQIDGGTDYYIARAAASAAGYLAVCCGPEPGRMQLSKIYVDAAFRRQGIGRAAVEFAASECRARGCGILWLSVNRFNSTAISFYEALGFVNTGAVVTDIGEGFVMDDYRMELKGGRE